MKFPQIATLAMLMACAGAALAQDQAPQDATATQAVRTTPTTPVAPAPLERAVQQAVHAVDPQKAKVIRRLLEVTGAANIGQQMMDAMVVAEKQSHPDVDPKILDRLRAKLDVNDMLEMVVAIYDRHFSTEDLQATLDFYQSPAGQRVLKELPPVMKESMAVGQAWGRQKAMELMKELEREQQQAPPTKA
ncbi:MAG TPA: DUF2059 domain-containing protein [Luteimonas sp.]|nr:DUF2059 domain-containing protein [Luteimonas sp.]